MIFDYNNLNSFVEIINSSNSDRILATIEIAEEKIYVPSVVRVE